MNAPSRPQYKSDTASLDAVGMCLKVRLRELSARFCDASAREELSAAVLALGPAPLLPPAHSLSHGSRRALLSSSSRGRRPRHVWERGYWSAWIFLVVLDPSP